MLGQEETCGKSGTPEKAQFHLNATSLVHTSRHPTIELGIEPLTDGIPGTCWWKEYFPISYLTKNLSKQFSRNNSSIHKKVVVEGKKVGNQDKD